MRLEADVCLANLFHNKYYKKGAYVPIIPLSRLYAEHLNVILCAPCHPLFFWWTQELFEDCVKKYDMVFEWKNENKFLLGTKPGASRMLNRKVLNQPYPYYADLKMQDSADMLMKNYFEEITGDKDGGYIVPFLQKYYFEEMTGEIEKAGGYVVPLLQKYYHKSCSR